MARIGSYPDPGEIVYSSRFLKSDLTLTQSQLQLGRRGGGVNSYVTRLLLPWYHNCAAEGGRVQTRPGICRTRQDQTDNCSFLVYLSKRKKKNSNQSGASCCSIAIAILQWYSTRRVGVWIPISNSSEYCLYLYLDGTD